MNRLVPTLLLLAGSSFAQSAHVHTAPPMVKGIEHPELVSDRRAWLTQLIAVTSASEQATLHVQALGLDGLDLAPFRKRYDGLVADYNGYIKTYNSPDAVNAAQQELFNNIDLVVMDMVSYLYRNLSKPEWDAVNGRLQESKKRMAFAADKVPDNTQPALMPSAFRLVQQDFNQNSYAGYTSYTALETDGVFLYQSVYVYGASNVTWNCTLTYEGPYNGWQYTPPGCTPNSPPQHTFYATNQLNGAGPNGNSLGSYTAPTYVNLSNSQKGRVTGNDTSNNGIGIVCNWIGEFYFYVGRFFIQIGNEYVQYDGQVPTFGVYGVTPTCTNPRPWLVDVSYIETIGAPAAAAAWNCWGVCTRTGPGLSWSCPPRLFKGICLPLPAPIWGKCTPHP